MQWEEAAGGGGDAKLLPAVFCVSFLWAEEKGIWDAASVGKQAPAWKQTGGFCKHWKNVYQK